MPVQRNHHCSWMSDSTSLAYMNVITQSCHNLVAGLTMPRSHCADHSLPMFPIIADRHDLSWSWQNHQIVSLTAYLCLSKTASTILVRQLYDTSTTEVFDPLLIRFPRPLVRPLIRSTRLQSRCWRPHPRSCRFGTTIKTTQPTKERPSHAFDDLQKTAVRNTRSPVRYRYDLTNNSHDHVPDRGDRLNRHWLVAERW